MYVLGELYVNTPVTCYSVQIQNNANTEYGHRYGRISNTIHGSACTYGFLPDSMHSTLQS